MLFLASSNPSARRDRMMMLSALAAAKAATIVVSMSLIPPVTKMVFLLADRRGLDGEMAGQGSQWERFVKGYMFS